MAETIRIRTFDCKGTYRDPRSHVARDADRRAKASAGDHTARSPATSADAAADRLAEHLVRAREATAVQIADINKRNREFWGR